MDVANEPGAVTEYRLADMRDELPALVGVSTKTEAYQAIANETGCSVPYVRRWFTDESLKFYSPPPQVKQIWLYLEELSVGKLKRTTYYEKPDFWD